MTYAFAYDQENILLYDGIVGHNNNRILTIQNIESFYNYRTIDDDFKLASSVLSNENNFNELKIKGTGTVPNRIYAVTPQNNTAEQANLAPYDSNSNYLNLHLKMNRIKSALAKKKDKTPENDPSNSTTNNDFLNYFCLSSASNDNKINNNIVSPQRICPNFCRPPQFTPKKPACSKCEEIRSFTMESLLHPTKSLSQSDILDELQNHFHPRSRLITIDNITHQRSTQEAARELADHYIFAHNKIEPIFL